MLVTFGDGEVLKFVQEYESKNFKACTPVPVMLSHGGVLELGDKLSSFIVCLVGLGK